MSVDTKLAEALNVLQPTAQVILSSRPMDFEDANYVGFQPLLDQPMREVLHAYEGTNPFLRSLRSKPIWTARQSRAVANVLRRSLRGEGQSAPAAAKQPVKCFGCQMEFPTWDDLKTHKIVCLGRNAPASYPPPSGPPVTPDKRVNVLPDYVPEHNVDLRLFPAARYAVEDSSGRLRFIIITEIKRRSRLTGRFIWTKYHYANEYLDKGDRTVREQAGDTKKLIGKQRTNEPVYFGEEENIIKMISENPTEAMIRYGKEKGACAYCGRSLTDEESRKRGIGPDCWEAKHIPYQMRRADAAIAAYQASLA
jgi:hypothetical protein